MHRTCRTVPGAARGRWRRLQSATALVLLLAGTAISGYAQSLFDPSNRIYRHLAIWELRGYFAPLPELRPYAPQLIVQLLREVASKGDARDRELAESYLEALAPRTFGDASALPPIEVGVRASVESSPDPAPRIRVAGELVSTYVADGLFAYSAMLSYWWQSGAERRLSYTVPQVPARGLNLYGRDVGAGDVRAAATFGEPGLHLQAGFAQHGFGSALHDSLVLAAGAPAAARISGVYRGATFSYSASLLQLVAERAVTRMGQRYLLKSGCPQEDECPRPVGFPSKYLMLHALQWYPLPWMKLSLFSSWLFGARASLYQLLPTAPVTEPFTGDYDNGLTGGTLWLRLPADFSTGATLFVDDYHPINRDGSVSLFTNKMAGQATLSWAPSGLPAVVSLDYLFVSPYTYTHSSHQPINYLTYTHKRQPLGTALPPDSDRWTLAALVTPVPQLDLELAARLIRHGAGSIWDDGYDDNGKATFVGGAPDFLDPVTETAYQLEVAATGRVPIATLELAARISYGLEYLESGSTADHLIGVQVGISL